MKISITNFWTQSPHFGLSGTAHALTLVWTQSLLTLRFCVSNATPAEGEVRALKSKQQFPRRKHTPSHIACKEEEPTLSTVWREGSPPQRAQPMSWNGELSSQVQCSGNYSVCNSADFQNAICPYTYSFDVTYAPLVPLPSQFKNTKLKKKKNTARLWTITA